MQYRNFSWEINLFFLLNDTRDESNSDAVMASFFFVQKISIVKFNQIIKKNIKTDNLEPKVITS